MQLESIKTTVAVVWVLAVGAAGLALHVASLSGWAVVAALAVFPPLAMMWWWHAPRETMSESIREVLR
jgi:hypothetical protein